MLSLLIALHYKKISNRQPAHFGGELLECAEKAIGVPKGVRTPVAAVRGRSPRPLDDGDLLELPLY